MKYENIEKARFISRPNRFIANIELGGEEHVCHVKNTGRCRELLVPGAEIFVQRFAPSQKRKTLFDLIAVRKGNRLINMDSQIPNRVFLEWAEKGSFLPDIGNIKPESTYKNSRFDFRFERGGKTCYAEVKGVTLEENGVVMFPDAPTERGVKHIFELMDCVKCGFEAHIIFVIQMEGVRHFTPNRKTHPEFADALELARDAGVNIHAYDCTVVPDEITLRSPVAIIF